MDENRRTATDYIELSPETEGAAVPGPHFSFVAEYATPAEFFRNVSIDPFAWFPFGSAISGVSAVREFDGEALTPFRVVRDLARSNRVLFWRELRRLVEHEFGDAPPGYDATAWCAEHATDAMLRTALDRVLGDDA